MVLAESEDFMKTAKKAGVTIIAICLNTLRLSFFARAARRQRWIVGKSHAALPNLLAKNTILLDEIFNYLLFPPVNPTSNANNKKGKWIQTRSHPGSLSRAKRRVSRMQ